MEKKSAISITCAKCTSPRRLDLLPAELNGGAAYLCGCEHIDAVSLDRMSLTLDASGYVGPNFGVKTIGR